MIFPHVRCEKCGDDALQCRRDVGAAVELERKFQVRLGLLIAAAAATRTER
jgi:hypothetical protein